MQIGDGLVGAFVFVAIVAALIIGGITWMGSRVAYGTIESDTRIEPELKLTIKDNKVDTVYIYRRP